MALMFPKQPRSGTKSFGEKVLFKEFEKKLPDTYKVFHSVAWLTKTERGIEEGETDFVVIEPTGGILILEVKGGNVTYDGIADKWESNGEEISDPFGQGKKAKWCITDHLNKIFNRSVSFHIGYGVAFPDIEVPDNLGIDKPREFILDRNDVENLASCITTMFQQIKPYSSVKDQENQEIYKKLESIFYSSQNINKQTTEYFRKLNQVVERLTEEQYIIIDTLKRHRKAAISGCAGSGKTLVAIEKAVRLHNEGFSVLILCHNPYLAKSILERVSDNGIVVLSFEELIDRVNKDPEAQLTIARYPELEQHIPWTQFMEPKEFELEMALDNLIKYPLNFDAVIVDEGQDFKDNWWMVVEACLADKANGIFYIFFDERQNIAHFEPPRYIVPQLPFELSRNCRNMGEIFKYVQQLGDMMPPLSEELSGEGIVREWLYSSENMLIPMTIEALIDAGKYSHEFQEIAVITAENCSLQKSKLNGIVFSTAESQNASSQTPLEWKNTVLKYLSPMGLPENMITEALLPTERDVDTIKSFCSRWLDRHRTESIGYGKSHIKHPPVNWALDIYGKLGLYQNGVLIGENDIWEIMAFFSNRDWTNTLPRPVKLYRLTPVDDYQKYPFYKNVQLTNIARFKGLESNGIVFVYYDYSVGFDYSLRANLYVGLSRANHLLNIVTPIPIQDEITHLNKLSIH